MEGFMIVAAGLAVLVVLCLLLSMVETGVNIVGILSSGKIT
jgi:hypothetical protein